MWARQKPENATGLSAVDLAKAVAAFFNTSRKGSEDLAKSSASAVGLPNLGQAPRTFCNHERFDKAAQSPQAKNTINISGINKVRPNEFPKSAFHGQTGWAIFLSSN